MKALKTVAIALGVTLGALIVIPLVVLAGLFRLAEAHRGVGRGGARARPGRLLIEKPGALSAAEAAAGALEPNPVETPADTAGVVMSGPPLPRGVSRRASVLERRLAEAACVIVMVLWAANFVVVKSTIPILTPVGYAFVRFALAGVVLLAICYWREGSIGLPRRDILPLAGLGFIGFGVYQMLWGTALLSTSVGNSALLVGATPVFTALVAPLLGVDRLDRVKVLGIAIAFGGVAIVAASHGLSLDSAALGDLLTLAAGVSWAFYVSLGAGVLRRFSALRATSWTVAFGALSLAPVGLWQLSGVDLAQTGPAQIAAIAYSGLLSSALGNVVVFWGISLLGPTRITNLQFLPPALAIVFAAIFLGDPILAGQVLGGAIIVAGVMLARRSRAPRLTTA